MRSRTGSLMPLFVLHFATTQLSYCTMSPVDDNKFAGQPISCWMEIRQSTEQLLDPSKLQKQNVHAANLEEKGWKASTNQNNTCMLVHSPVRQLFPRISRLTVPSWPSSDGIAPACKTDDRRTSRLDHVKLHFNANGPLSCRSKTPIYGNKILSINLDLGQDLPVSRFMGAKSSDISWPRFLEARNLPFRTNLDPRSVETSLPTNLEAA